MFRSMLFIQQLLEPLQVVTVRVSLCVYHFILTFSPFLVSLPSPSSFIIESSFNLLSVCTRFLQLLSQTELVRTT